MLHKLCMRKYQTTAARHSCDKIVHFDHTTATWESWERCVPLQWCKIYIWQVAQINAESHPSSAVILLSDVRRSGPQTQSEKVAGLPGWWTLERASLTHFTHLAGSCDAHNVQLSQLTQTILQCNVMSAWSSTCSKLNNMNYQFTSLWCSWLFSTTKWNHLFHKSWNFSFIMRIISPLLEHQCVLADHKTPRSLLSSYALEECWSSVTPGSPWFSSLRLIWFALLAAEQEYPIRVETVQLITCQTQIKCSCPTQHPSQGQVPL